MRFAQQYGLKLWLRADIGIQYGATMRPGGTAPPEWTLTGTATRPVNIHAEIDSVAGGVDRGQATYKWRENENAAYTTGVLTAAGPTALGTTGLSVSQAVGPYNIDNTWDITVAQWNDQSGNANHAVQAVAANQPRITLTGFGGYAAVEFSDTHALVTPSISLAGHAVIVAARGDALSGTIVSHSTAGNLSYLYSTVTFSSWVARGAVGSGKNVSAGWMRDGVRRTIGKTFNGTHASHLIYRQGVDVNATNGAQNNDPGLTPAAGAFYVGGLSSLTGGMIGAEREVIVLGAYPPPDVMLALHKGIAARCAGAI